MSLNDPFVLDWPLLHGHSVACGHNENTVVPEEQTKRHVDLFNLGIYALCYSFVFAVLRITTGAIDRDGYF